MIAIVTWPINLFFKETSNLKKGLKNLKKKEDQRKIHYKFKFMNEKFFSSLNSAFSSSNILQSCD